MLPSTLFVLNYFIFPLYECPNHQELRCVSARFMSSRLSQEEVDRVRPLVIATQRDAVTVSCNRRHAPFTLRDASISIDYSRYIPLPTATLHNPNCISGLPFLGLGALTRTWTNFVLTPDEMILNPQPNTTVICQTGEFPEVYFRSASEQYWSVRSEIRMSGVSRNNETTQYFDMKIDSGSIETHINEERYNEFIEAILNQSFQVVETRHGNWGFATVIENCNGRGRRRLPIISFTIYDPVENRPVTELQIGPDDYLTSDCRLTIRASPISHPIGVIGDNILKNLAIHFRADSATMGFCDPV